MSPDVNAPPTAIVSALPAVVANHLPVALTVLLKVVVCPAPNSLMPATCDPVTPSAPAEPNVMSPLTALISPHAAPAVAAKLIGTFNVTSPVLWFSIFACVPVLSNKEMVAELALLRFHDKPPVHSSWFML